MNIIPINVTHSSTSFSGTNYEKIIIEYGCSDYHIKPSPTGGLKMEEFIDSCTTDPSKFVYYKRVEMYAVINNLGDLSVPKSYIELVNLDFRFGDIAYGDLLWESGSNEAWHNLFGLVNTENIFIAKLPVNQCIDYFL